MWIEYNPSPVGARVGDCSVRAIAKALDIDWEKAFALLVANAYRMGDMPSSNVVIASVLRQNGFKRTNLPNKCPDCYTIKNFCKDNQRGTYVLGTGNHVVAVVNGDYYDTWDSGNEIPVYVWYLPH